MGAVRRAWPDVLEDVKHRRRVAWMILIGDVHVADVNERALTLAFAKDGDRKGFVTSGCDTVLQEALQQVLGVHWEIRTNTGPMDTSAEGQPPAAAPPADSQQGPASAPRAAGAGSPGSAADTAGNGASRDDPPSGADMGGSQPDSGDWPVPDEPGQELETSAETEIGTGSGPPEGEPPASTPPSPSLAEPAGHDDLSGMALIQRELGAEVIEEIDDT